MAMNLKKELQSVNKYLKALSKRVEKILIAVDKLEKPKAANAKSVKKAVDKKEKGKTAPEIVLAIIKRSRKGVNIGTLKEKTGFKGQKLYNTLYVLKKQGKVNNPNKGIYVKA